MTNAVKRTIGKLHIEKVKRNKDELAEGGSVYILLEAFEEATASC